MAARRPQKTQTGNETFLDFRAGERQRCRPRSNGRNAALIEKWQKKNQLS